MQNQQDNDFKSAKNKKEDCIPENDDFGKV